MQIRILLVHHHLHITVVVMVRYSDFQSVNWRLHLIMRRSVFYVGVLDVEAHIKVRGANVVRVIGI